MYTRRRLLTAATGAAGLAGALALPGAVSAAPTDRRVGKNGSLKVSFFTDAHVPIDKETLKPTPNNARVTVAFERMAREKPDLVLFGGDNVGAVDGGHTEANARAQFDNWSALVKTHVRAPHVSVIGNHDIWYPKDTKPDDRKAMARAAFGMPNRYYAVDRGAWKFLMLDTFHDDGCHIDAPQMEWLKKEIAADPKKHIALVSHASILTVSCFIERGKPQKGAWNVPVGWMVENANELRDLFLQHPNVRLSLSGHMHHLDRCDYDAVTYLCGGAVSGSWWGGDYLHFAPAFVNLELFDDGTFTNRTIFWEKIA
ncbi:MAG: metallophosphoesterase [Cytophagales bacterium]|nr:metallophosphoesterase [Armatimonadota bacterium]